MKSSRTDDVIVVLMVIVIVCIAVARYTINTDRQLTETFGTTNSRQGNK